MAEKQITSFFEVTMKTGEKFILNRKGHAKFFDAVEELKSGGENKPVFLLDHMNHELILNASDFSSVREFKELR